MQLSLIKRGEYWKHLVCGCGHVCACRQALLAQVLSRKAKEEVLLSFLDTGGKGPEKPHRVQFKVYNCRYMCMLLTYWSCAHDVCEMC